MKDKPKSQFLNELIEKWKDGHRSEARTLLFTGEIKTLPPLIKVLGLTENEISPTIKEAAEALEELGEDDSAWKRFKWRILFFIELQDIFDGSIYSGEDIKDSIFQLWYFYYEAKYLLYESILSGLSGHYQSSQIVLRTFLEFNILQNYFYRSCYEAQSFKILETYIKNSQTPSWSKLVGKSLPKDEFSKPIKYRLDIHLKSLSKVFVHPYHPQHSAKLLSKASIPQHSMDGLCSFWRLTDFILEAVIWQYSVNFPNLFHPKKIVDKFGFTPPMGLFMSESQVQIIKNSFEEKDYVAFKNYSDKDGDVIGLSEWYESMPSLSEEEIIKTWNTESNGKYPDNIEQGWLLVRAKMRSIRELMAIASVKSILLDLKEDKTPENLTYDFWKNLLKSSGKK